MRAAYLPPPRRLVKDPYPAGEIARFHLPALIGDAARALEQLGTLLVDDTRVFGADDPRVQDLSNSRVHWSIAAWLLPASSRQVR
ncbi:hypothetical protein UG55_100170 [Frankia sp. EI5c]|nr:hypothetical protein UG55_100170 [Frankia sp. EI5c]